jgi:hypothetical protein
MRDDDLLERRRALLYTVIQAELYRPGVAFSCEEFQCLLSDLKEGRPVTEPGEMPDLTGIINSGALGSGPAEQRTVADYVDEDEEFSVPPKDDFLYLFGAGYLFINDDFEMVTTPRAWERFSTEHVIRKDLASLSDTEIRRYAPIIRRNALRRECDYLEFVSPEEESDDNYPTATYSTASPGL